MGDMGEESQFVVDEVSAIIKQAIEDAIGGNAYQQSKVNQWTSTVVVSCLTALTKLEKSFKYIVTCTIMQKNGAGLHTSSSCYWDNNTDGSCTVRWENKTIATDKQDDIVQSRSAFNSINEFFKIMEQYHVNFISHRD